jgi:diguanylate cyclase (GGDEF)-like protein
MLDTIDITDLSLVRDCISGITGIPLSVYGENGHVILPLIAENKVMTFIRASNRGKDEYQAFMKKSVESVRLRRGISVYKGLGGQHYLVIPIRIDSVLFVIIGGGIYLSQKDFEEFYAKEGNYYGVQKIQVRSWLQEIDFKDYGEIQQTARHIQELFHYFFRNSRENSLSAKKYRLTKTILDLLAGVDPGKQIDDVYDLLGDILLFLFNADSVSVMVEDKKEYKQVKAAGRLKRYLESLSIHFTHSLAEAIREKELFYTEDIKEIVRLGFDHQITSVYVFPIVLSREIVGFICIFNTKISQDDVGIISELCKLAGFIFKIVNLQYTYMNRLKHMDMLNTAAANIFPLKIPNALYETIVDMSAYLAEAEKGSLMLCENGSPYLAIKAAKGINKRLLDEIKVRAGEGIAGKVFEDGVPLMVSDIEKNNQLPLKRRPRYKTGSFISIPLVSFEKTIGVLNISDKISGEVFSDEDLSLLHSFAAYASIAIERTLYYNLVGLLKESSITDSLTGLFNRRYFEERLFEELNRSERHELPFSFAIIDVDDFKLFNDTEGHLAGDDVLKSISGIAKDSLRIIDVIARFGGEEFAVIMPQTEKEEAFTVVERIRKAVRGMLPRTWKKFPKNEITICIGVSTFPIDGKNRVDLIRNADKALYCAKMQGKDRTIVCGQEG